MKNLTLITLLIISLLTACKRDRFENDNSGALSLTEFDRKFKVPTQSFNQVAGTPFTITGGKGIKLDFPANAFLDASGNPVIGNVKLTLKEVMSKRDLMLSGKFTESNKQLLVSGGEFEILALQGSQLLKLNPAATVNVSVPTTFNTQPMDLFVFTGTTVSDSTWILNQKIRIATSPTYYQFSLPNFGWVNCDYFYSNPNPKTTITASPVYATAAPSVKEQRCYLIFDNINNVIGLPFELSVNKHQSYLNSMPIGLTGQMVIISVDVNDKIYFGHTSFTISSGLHVNVPVSLATQHDIDSYLNTIN